MAAVPCLGGHKASPGTGGGGGVYRSILDPSHGLGWAGEKVPDHQKGQVLS